METNPYAPPRLPETAEPRTGDTMQVVPGTTRQEKVVMLTLSGAVVAGLVIAILMMFDGPLMGGMMLVPVGLCSLIVWWHRAHESDAVVGRVRPMIGGRPAKWGGTAKRHGRGWFRKVPGYLFVTEREVAFYERPLAGSPDVGVMQLSELIGFGGDGLGLVSRAGEMVQFDVKNSARWRETMSQACVNREGSGEHLPPVFQMVESVRGLFIAWLLPGSVGLRFLLPKELQFVYFMTAMVLTAVWVAGLLLSARRKRQRVLDRLAGLQGERLLLGGVAGPGELFLSTRALIHFPRRNDEAAEVIPVGEIGQGEANGRNLTIRRKDGSEMTLPVDEAKVWAESLNRHEAAGDRTGEEPTE